MSERNTVVSAYTTCNVQQPGHPSRYLPHACCLPFMERDASNRIAVRVGFTAKLA